MLLIILPIILILLISFAIAGESAAPWVPARKHDIERFLTAGEVKSGDRVYDLGCGDGRLVSGAAKRGAMASGYEISFVPYLLARIRGFIRQKTVGSYTIHFQNLWKVDISQADVIFLFLLPKVLEKMTKKILAEAKPGTRIVNYVWPLPGLTPVRIEEAVGFPKLYVYVMNDVA